MSKAKFCVFCGSETPNVELALRHKEKYDEYQQVSAILAMEIELKHDMVHHDEWTKEQLIELFDDLMEEREKLISDAEYRAEKFDLMKMLLINF